jgi:tRNA G18 (ribose-2'-O)-methylase SpoU
MDSTNTLTFHSVSSLEKLNIYHQLRDKVFQEEQSFVADSPKVINIILQTDIEIKSILATQEYYDEFQKLIEQKLLNQKEKITLYLATKEQMQTLVGHKLHHNAMLHGVRPQPTPLQALDDNIIMLDSITSTENIGSIARSAAALGVNSYLIPSNAPHPYSRRSLRVSMGHISKLHFHIYDDIKETIPFLQKKGYKVFAAEVAKDALKLQDVVVPNKWVILMGHEGKGLSKEIIDICDSCVEIEMSGEVRSFNVGVAASLMMYTFKMK